MLENSTSKEDTIISTAIAKAYERVGIQSDEKNIINTVVFIKDEFSDLKLNQFIEALKNGASGKYGRTYRMSPQEICIWIREYKKNYKEPIDKSKYVYYRWKHDPTSTRRKIAKEKAEEHFSSYAEGGYVAIKL